MKQNMSICLKSQHPNKQAFVYELSKVQFGVDLITPINEIYLRQKKKQKKTE